MWILVSLRSPTLSIFTFNFFRCPSFPCFASCFVAPPFYHLLFLFPYPGVFHIILFNPWLIPSSESRKLTRRSWQRSVGVGVGVLYKVCVCVCVYGRWQTIWCCRVLALLYGSTQLIWEIWLKSVIWQTGNDKQTQRGEGGREVGEALWQYYIEQ